MKTKQPWDVKRYEEAKTHEVSLWNKLHNAPGVGKARRVSYLTRRYFNSYHVKYVHAVEAARRLKPHRRKKITDFDSVVRSIDVYRVTDEPVVFDIKQKNSGHEYRHIKDFGIEHRTMQRMVLAVLTARTTLHPHQFANKGGRNDAAKLVVESLNEGFGYCVELDIKNCFPSVSVEALSDVLPIPKAVIAHVISSESYCPLPGSTLWNTLDPGGDLRRESVWTDILAEELAEEFSEGRRGLPQGSAVSSYLMELLLAPLIATAPEGGRLVGYADNILVMSKTEDDTVSMLFSLGAALKGHPAGPFKSRRGEVSSPGTEFEFLGYEFQPSHGDVKLVPSSKNLAKFQHGFDKSLEKLANPKVSRGKRKNIKENLRRYVSGWCACFGHWSKIESFREHRMKDIAEASAKGAD